MQKKLIALAVAAVVSAPAFADVTPYGIVDGAVASFSATGQKSDLIALSGGASTSRFGVKATEDLGDGLTALAVLEYGLDSEVNATVGTDSSGNLKARQQLLGLAGSFGTVATGYLQTTGYDFAGKFDPLAGSLASPLQNVTGGTAKNTTHFLIGTNAGATRAQRALAYISPDFNGLSFAVNYSTALSGLGDLTTDSAAATSATTPDALKSTAYLLSGSYAAGPLNVGLVYASASNAHPTTTIAGTGYKIAADVTEFALGGSYDFGVAKLLATYQSNKVSVNFPVLTTPSFTNSAISVSGVIPVGADAIAVSYAMNSMDKAYPGVMGDTTKDKSARGYTVGYLHTLSKTTTAYAAYSAMTQDNGTYNYSVGNNALAGSAATDWVKGGGSSSLIGVGLRKKF